MLAALIIVFRETIEAGLIVGIALAVTRGVAGSGRWVAGGVGAGVLGSVLLAAGMARLSAAFAGMGQELFNAAILAVAVVMLGWHNIWMARHGRQTAADLRATGAAVVAGSSTVAAMAVVCGVAVLREGAEVVLFLYGILASGEAPGALVTGGLGGLALGALVTGLTYAGLVRIPMRRLFAVSGLLIAVLAAGMAAQSVAFLESAGVVQVFGETLWNSSAILSQTSLPGRVLHAMVGYMDRPTLAEALAYAVVLSAILGLGRLLRPAAAGPARAA